MCVCVCVCVQLLVQIININQYQMQGININIKSHFTSPQSAKGLEIINVGEKIIVDFVYTRITNKSQPIYLLYLHIKLVYIFRTQYSL